MEIKNVGGVTPTPNSNNSKRPLSINPEFKITSDNDSLNVSNEARILEDEAFIKDVLTRTPDINIEKIARVKEKLANGDYNNKEVLDTLTKNLIKALGL